MEHKNIAVSGDIASGKSTLARNLADKLGWKFLSMGAFFREWHIAHNIPLANANEVPEELDREIDMKYQRLMQEDSHTVFESHLAGWLAKDIPNVFRVLCVADLEIRVKRASKRDEVSIDEVRNDIAIRSKNLADKFERLYGVKNSFDPTYFDLVVDTSTNNPEEAVQLVLAQLA